MRLATVRATQRSLLKRAKSRHPCISQSEKAWALQKGPVIWAAVIILTYQSSAPGKHHEGEPVPHHLQFQVLWPHGQRKGSPGASLKAEPAWAAANCWHRTGQVQIALAFLWSLSPNHELGLFIHLFSFVFLTNAPMLPNRTSRCGFSEMCEWFHHTVVNKGLNTGDTSQEGLRWTEIPGKGRHAHSFWSSRPSASNPEGFMLSLPELSPIFKEPRIWRIGSEICALWKLSFSQIISICGLIAFFVWMC